MGLLFFVVLVISYYYYYYYCELGRFDCLWSTCSFTFMEFVTLWACHNFYIFIYFTRHGATLFESSEVGWLNLRSSNLKKKILKLKKKRKFKGLLSVWTHLYLKYGLFVHIFNPPKIIIKSMLNRFLEQFSPKCLGESWSNVRIFFSLGFLIKYDPIL